MTRPLHHQGHQAHHPNDMGPGGLPPTEARGGSLTLPPSTPNPPDLGGPRQISAYTRPDEQIHEIIDAVHDTYPGRVWLRGGRPHQLEAGGRLATLTPQKWRSLVTMSAVLLVGKEKPEAHRIPRAMADDAYHCDEVAPELQGVRWFPWIEDDGTIVSEPGEHDGWLLHWTEAPADPDDVSEEQMWEVLGRLLDHPFVSEADRVGYLALLVRAVRPLVGCAAPLTLIRASSKESGKSYAVRVLGTLLTGTEPKQNTPTAGTELGYTLNAMLRDPQPLQWIDNVDTGSTVGGATLHALITSNGWVSSRTVGTSDMGGGNPTHSIWTATGNQLGTDDEQSRRSVVINLRRRRDDEPFVTDDLVGWVRDNRRLCACALLRFVAEWHRRQSPRPSRVLPSFESWSYLVGGPVASRWPGGSELWLSEASRPVPPVEAAWDRFFDEHWFRGSKGDLEPMTSSEILAAVELAELPALVDLAGPGSEHSRKIAIGNALQVLAGRDTSDPIARRWTVKYYKAKGRSRYLPARWRPKESRDPTQVGSSTGDPTPDPTPGMQPPCASVGCGGSVEEGTPPHIDPPPSVDLPPPYPTHPTDPTHTVEGGIVGVGSGVGSGVDHPTPSIQVPDDDPACYQIRAMALRGVQLDRDLWGQRYQLAERILSGRVDDPEERDRLRSLRAYGPSVAALAAMATDSRVRCGWRLEGTGRLRTVAPNLQGVTKGHGLREALVAAEGHRLISADWDAAHVWLAAGRSGDDELLQALDDGDVYVRGSAYWAPELDPEQGRRAAKVAILSTLNGAGPEKLSEILARFGARVPAPMAHGRRREWLERYPQLRQWMAESYGHRRWRTHLGRWVELPADVGDHAAVGWWLQSAESDALRIVLQRYNGRIVLTNQDEVLAEEPSEHAELQAAHLQSVMDEALAEVCGLDTIHHTTTVDVRDSWGEK